MYINNLVTPIFCLHILFVLKTYLKCIFENNVNFVYCMNMKSIIITVNVYLTNNEPNYNVYKRFKSQDQHKEL